MHATTCCGTILMRNKQFQKRRLMRPGRAVYHSALLSRLKPREIDKSPQLVDRHANPNTEKATRQNDSSNGDSIDCDILTLVITKIAISHQAAPKRRRAERSWNLFGRGLGTYFVKIATASRGCWEAVAVQRQLGSQIGS